MSRLEEQNKKQEQNRKSKKKQKEQPAQKTTASENICKQMAFLFRNRKNPKRTFADTTKKNWQAKEEKFILF